MFDDEFQNQQITILILILGCHSWQPLEMQNKDLFHAEQQPVADDDDDDPSGDVEDTVDDDDPDIAEWFNDL